MRIPTWAYVCLFIVLLIGTILVYREIFAPPALTITVLKAEKSPTVLVESPGGERFLINTGADASVLRELGAALSPWQRRLDAIIITSPVASATGGLTDVISRYKTTTLYRSAAAGSRAQETLIENALGGASFTHLARGDRLALGGGAYADILWPPEYADRMKTADAAIQLLLSYGSTTVLIQTDLPPHAEEWSAIKSLPTPNLTISSTTPVGVYRY